SAKALIWYRKAAEQGHADAQNNLGSVYELGQGVTANRATATEWYRRAATQGHMIARANLRRLSSQE
ncbi:MAG: sel1 repeat family protein, partial [Candidatus Melainabacteria bacterium HGW-Melainabacteria-1]